MITVRLRPKVEPCRRGGWELVLYVSDALDDTHLLRASLSEIAGALSSHAETESRLPAYKAWEDFVEGTLHFGPYILSVYFEHSLEYLSLNCPDQVPLDAVWAILSDAIAVE